VIRRFDAMTAMTKHITPARLDLVEFVLVTPLAS